MKTFQVTWNNQHIFKVLSSIVPEFFSLIIRQTTRIANSIQSAVSKYFSSSGDTALNSSASVNASKALGVVQGILPSQKVDSVSHKVLEVSNTGYTNIFAYILFCIGAKISNSTVMQNSATAISALVTKLESRQVKLVDKMTILSNKYESVKNGTISRQMLTIISFKTSICNANLYVTNSTIDIIKKMYSTVAAKLFIGSTLHFNMIALKKLSEIDALTLGDIDALTLGNLDVSQEY